MCCCALRSFLHPLQNQVSSKLMTGISCPLLLKNTRTSTACAVARPSSTFWFSPTKLRLAISHVGLLCYSKSSGSARMSLLWCFRESTTKDVIAAREARPRLEYKSSSCASSCFPLLHETARVSCQKEHWGGWYVFPWVFSSKSSWTKRNVCGSLTPTVFYPNKGYQNLCIGQLACSYEILSHLSCQISKNDNLSVCERKSQPQGVEDHKASSILPWLSSSLSHFFSSSTPKKKRTSALCVFSGLQKVSINRHDALLLFAF